jgi:hypothetical protein
MVHIPFIPFTAVIQAHQTLFFCALALAAETIALALAPFIMGKRARWWSLLALIPLGLFIWSLVLESQFITIYQRYYLLVITPRYPALVPEMWSNYATQVIQQAEILQWTTIAVTIGQALLAGWAMFRRLPRHHNAASALLLLCIIGLSACAPGGAAAQATAFPGRHIAPQGPACGENGEASLLLDPTSETLYVFHFTGSDPANVDTGRPVLSALDANTGRQRWQVKPLAVDGAR